MTCSTWANPGSQGVTWSNWGDKTTWTATVAAKPEKHSPQKLKRRKKCEGLDIHKVWVSPRKQPPKCLFCEVYSFSE